MLTCAFYRNAITTSIDIAIGQSGNYALVLFETIKDAISACYTLIAHSKRQWMVDFQPVGDYIRMQIRYHQWQRLCG
jgi:hypothetical protein